MSEEELSLNFITNTLNNYNNKTITEDELRKIFNLDNYSDFYNFAKKLLDNKVIEGKGPLNKMPNPMYTRFKILSKYSKETTNTDLDYLYPALNVSYYKNSKNKATLEKHYPYIKQLSEFLNKCLVSDENTLMNELSINERSFEIWQDEKFLESDEGKDLLKNLDFPVTNLNAYKSREPYFDYFNDINNKGYMFIVENKDTWYSLRKEMKATGNLHLFDKSFTVIVYGEGKKILKSFEYFEERLYREYIDGIFYLGDLDYEGISIFNQLVEKYPDYNIKPFVEMYNYMIIKSKKLIFHRKSKAKQSKYKINEFLCLIDDKEYIKNILVEGFYIPQEIINYREITLLNKEGV